MAMAQALPRSVTIYAFATRFARVAGLCHNLLHMQTIHAGRYLFSSCLRSVLLVCRPIYLFIIAMTTACSTPFDLQGHRGARGLLPENTLPAYEQALRIGVTTLELDVGVSSDGVVVISHDRALNPEITRDAAGQWLPAPVLVNTLTLQQLQSYDVGRINPASDYARRFASQTPRDGTHMPTLAELFERMQAVQANAVQFNIETKISPEQPGETVSLEVFVDKLLAVVRAHGMQARVIVQSFDWRTLALVQQRAPGMRTAYLTAQQPWTDNIQPKATDSPRWTGAVRYEDHSDVPSMVKAAGGHIWSPYFGDVTAALVQKAHALGLKVVPWTVNTEQDLQAIIDLGVDGLISDYPDRARRLLQRTGRSLPAPVRLP
jgi:glycerophosphoryl diester phosphodiesterase